MIEWMASSVCTFRFSLNTTMLSSSFFFLERLFLESISKLVSSVELLKRFVISEFTYRCSHFLDFVIVEHSTPNLIACHLRLDAGILGGLLCSCFKMQKIEGAFKRDTVL